jgi:hypothetical protein
MISNRYIKKIYTEYKNTKTVLQAMQDILEELRIARANWEIIFTCCSNASSQKQKETTRRRNS